MQFLYTEFRLRLEDTDITEEENVEIQGNSIQFMLHRRKVREFE